MSFRQKPFRGINCFVRRQKVRHGHRNLIRHWFQSSQSEFRELLLRWFAWAVFCPIFRLHGFRIPDDVARSPVKPVKPYGTDAINVFTNTGGSNEVWSWGAEILQLLRGWMELREGLRPYVAALMRDRFELRLLA